MCVSIYIYIICTICTRSSSRPHAEAFNATNADYINADPGSVSSFCRHES